MQIKYKISCDSHTEWKVDSRGSAAECGWSKPGRAQPRKVDIKQPVIKIFRHMLGLTAIFAFHPDEHSFLGCNHAYLSELSDSLCSECVLI